MKKALKIVGALLLAILVALFLAPILLEDSLIARVKDEVNKNLNATISYEDADLSFFKAFPYPSITLDNLSITGNAPFEDTELIRAEQLFLQVGLASIIHKDEAIELTKIIVKKPTIHIKTNKEGQSNTDIVKALEGSSEASYWIDIQSYSIEDGSLIYEDLQGQLYATIGSINHTGKGDFAQDIFDLQTSTLLENTTIKSSNVTLANNLTIKSELPIRVNTTDSKYSFTDGLININDFALKADGDIQLKDEGVYMDLMSKGNDNSVKEFLSLIPYAYTKDFDQVKASGTFTYAANAKGLYNSATNTTPAFDLTVDLKNGVVKYPDLSLPIENLNVDLTATNRTSNVNKTDIEIKPIQFSIDGETLFASIITRNSSIPYFEFDIDTDMDISKIQKAYPLTGIETLAGRMDIDIKTKGNTEDLLNQSFANLESTGQINLQNVVYKAIDQEPVSIDQFEGDYKNDQLTIAKLNLVAKPNDIQLEGKLSNVLNYYFNDQPLTGTLKAHSSNMDLNEYIETSDTTASQPTLANFDNIDVRFEYSADDMVYELYEIKDIKATTTFKNDELSIANGSGLIGESDFSLDGKVDNLYAYLYHQESLTGKLGVNSTLINYSDFVDESTAGTSEEIPLIPANIDIDINIKAKKILYDNITINDASTTLDLDPNRANLNNFEGKTFGGKIGLDGYYDTSDKLAPQFGVKYQMDKLNIAETLKASPTFKILAPIAAYIDGSLNSTFVMEGLLKNDLFPDLNSLTGTGFLETLEGKLVGYSPVEKINSLFNLESGEQWFLNSTKNWFEIQNGALQVKEFDYQFKDIPMKISGSHRFNQDMNYLIKASIPRKYLESTGIGKAVTKEFDEILSQINKRGLDIQSGSYVDADIILTGNIKSPKLELVNVKIADKPLTEQVKEQVMQKVDEKKAEIRDTINTKVDETISTINDTIQSKTDELRDTIASKADEIITEAKDQAKDVVFSQLDTLLSDRLPDSTLTDLKDKAADILNKNTKISVDSILNKIKNPFKIKRPGGNGGLW